MKKIIALVMAVTMVAAMMVGCGSSSKSDDSAKGNGEVTIKFGIHVADPKTQETVTYKIVQEFNKKYSGKYKVEFEAADTEAHLKNLKLEASSGKLPEIFWLDASQTSEYNEGGYLLDLSDFLKEYTSTDSALDASVKEAFKDGIQYGLPYQCNVEGFFYNKEVAKELGVEIKNGTTFDELLDIVKKCNDKGITAIAQGNKNSSYAIWGYLAMLDRYGYSDYINDILDGKKKFNNDDLLKCFEKLQSLAKAGAFAKNMATQEYFDAKNTFESGKALLFNSGAWDSSELDEKMGDKVGFWWGPTFSDSSYEQKAAMKVPSNPICVSSKVADDSGKKEAVYKFLEYYYSEEAAKMSYEGSVFPATNYTGIEVADTQHTLNEVVASINEGWVSPAKQPDLMLSSSVQSQLYDSILGVITGNYEPKDALAKIDEKMNY